MIIGHLPAGYVLAKLSYRKFSGQIGHYRWYMFWGLFGAVAPDLDMFYFHLIDHRSTHHHRYFSHFPIFWLGLLSGALLLYANTRTRSRLGIYAVLFTVSGFIHLLLDSIVGDIWWLAPFIDRPFALATVPALYHPWWLNFLLHWSFGLELLLVAWAGYLWFKKPAASPVANPQAKVGNA
ncbi:hypothetical protein IGB42_03375 [Andreprevotia sp. IGB-42]|uniref:metal-dependent hydrolase n=1 Tax=Andreprevotia sp. IGB-42 TaxID=2497473 RepID=UPI0013571645|nr:metal-dependent hydrolase [Andreprevotia sp. IGB-42]KAF0812098.1 hypothetical protein IGB42_03375 [Andreprevotia sp. IGB-42]